MTRPAVRWPVPLTVAPYVLLVLLAGATVAIERSSSLADLILCALLAAWMTGVRRIPPAVFVTVLIALTAVLVVRAPWFGFFSPIAYLCAFRLLRWPWQPIGVGAVAWAAGTAQAYGVDKSTAIGLVTYAAVVAANVVPMCAYAWFARRVAQQEQEREQALHEAREANRKLAASLVENAALQEQLLVQARNAGVQDERQRMAREIHDTLAQGLTGIISQLRAAESAGDELSGWRRHVAAASELAGESLAEARRSVHALRPEPLRSARLGEALTCVAERWSALHRIPVRVTTTGTVRPLGPDAEAALLRIAQEALANVGKHARASRVGVTLSYFDHEVALDVRDDGDGFDPARLGVAGPADGPGSGCLPSGAVASAPQGGAVAPAPQGGADASAPQGGADASAPQGGADASAPQGGADASAPQGGAVASAPQGGAVASASQGGGGVGGCGFGLIAMRQRIEGLSGTLQVESEPGIGTGISARVPAERTETYP